METEPEFDKRIVVEHVTGPLKGLTQIIGAVSELAKEGGTRLPTFMPSMRCGIGGTRDIPTGLIKVTPRRVIYKECAGPQLHRFDEFNPEQQ